MSYKLTDNVEDSFDFDIDGHVYDMKYPTVEELEQLQKLISDNEAAKAKGEKVNDDAVMEWMYSFITPRKEDSPSIADTMKKQNIKVLRNFTEMFKTEFGVE